MFKSWRSDKNKIKAAFKLQFQCTQVPKLKKSAVMISLVPDDVGKPTFKLEKVAVQDGTCLWENPIYLTVKLIREPKTGIIREKIYHFIVSTGSSKSGFLGEASIDFADFYVLTEPLTVSLPLKFANSGAVLHVTIEKIEGANDHRYVEENGDKNQQSNYNTDGHYQNFSEDALNSSWASGSDQNNQQDPGSLLSPLRQNNKPQWQTADAIKSNNYAHHRSNTDCSVGSISDGSLFDSTNSPDDNLPRYFQHASDDSVEKLKNEIVVMTRQAELSELELQSLRKQVAKESERAQDQTRHIISLCEERDALSIECQQLRKQRSTEIAGIERRLQSENEHLKVQQEEIGEELNYEKEVSEHLRSQLDNMQESNVDLMLAVKDLNETVEQKNMEISSLSRRLKESKIAREDLIALEALAKERNNDKEVDLLKQKISDQSDEIEFFKKHSEDLEIHLNQLTKDCEGLQQENQSLSSKLNKNQQQISVKSTECLESLAIIQELESQVERLEKKVKQQSEEYSESLISINETECLVKELKRELDNRDQEFEDDLDAVTRAKTEQEQRAIRAEEALRKTRWKNAVTAERLQEEFKRLSVEMASRLDENGKTVMKALKEADELHMQKTNLEEMLQKAKDELNRKSSKLEDAQKSEAKAQEAFSMEINMLKTEIEKLKREQYNFSKHRKLRDDAEPSVSTGESDVLAQRWERERDDLEKKFASAKKEAAIAHEELISVMSLKDEKETLIGNLQAELENLRLQHNKLQNSLNEEKLDKDNIRKQVFQLKDELQKKEEECSIADNSSPSKAVDDHKHTLRKKGKCSKKGLSFLDCSSEANFTEQSTEVTLLKEKNKHMETDLKQMQERYSEISLKFAEVEGERQQLVMTVRNLKNGKGN